MCTAVGDNQKYSMFGRTLDAERSYGERLVITPRRFPISFLNEGKMYEHFAMLGVARVEENQPLYFDGLNERGLCAAALRFPNYAVYHKRSLDKYNVASFELIPWILCRCETVEEAKALLSDTNVTDESFSDELAATPLHWMIFDGKYSITVESTDNGLKVYDNEYGVLTNAPSYPEQVRKVADRLRRAPARQTGIGETSVELPGDMSSSARFVRAAYTEFHTLPSESRLGAVSRFFHIMDTVSQANGVALGENGKPIRTIYTSCVDRERLIYYFTTYDCRRIRGVRLKNAYLDLDELAEFPMEREEWVHFLN
jgi:choloylglycine hydrolase